MKGASWQVGQGAGGEQHKKQKLENQEELGAGRGPGSDSIPGAGDNRLGSGTTLPLQYPASTDRAEGLPARALLRCSHLEGYAVKTGS